MVEYILITSNVIGGHSHPSPVGGHFAYFSYFIITVMFPQISLFMLFAPVYKCIDFSRVYKRKQNFLVYMVSALKFGYIHF
jgi:hypothetical protein